MTEKVELTDNMATRYCIGTYRANGKTIEEKCWLSAHRGGWIITINEHSLLDDPNEKYTSIYGSPCFIYKYGTQFYCKDEAIECFNKWLALGRTAEEESEVLRPEWEEFARRNKDSK